MNSEGSSRTGLLGWERKQGVREAELVAPGGRHGRGEGKAMILQWRWASVSGVEDFRERVQENPGAGERRLGLYPREKVTEKEEM